MQLAEVFEADIDPVMQSLGFCCGRKHTYSQQVKQEQEQEQEQEQKQDDLVGV